MLTVRVSSYVPLCSPMIGSSKTPIICCASALELQNAITVYIKTGTTVLELGSELGDVSSNLCNAVGTSGSVWLVDKIRSDKPNCRQEQNRRHENFQSIHKNSNFREVVEWSLWKEAIPIDLPYDIVFLSLSATMGHDLYLTLLSFMDEIVMTLTHNIRAFVIKSRALTQIGRRLIHSQRLFDGTTSLTQTSLSRTSQPPWIAAVKVDEYRKTIPYIIQKDDSIIELGCHFGRTAVRLEEAGRYRIGVDVGPSIIANAQTQYPHISFAIGDAWKTSHLLRLRKLLKQEDDMGYDVVYVDIGGLSGIDGHLEALSLLDALGYALEPRCIVIKSLCMRHLAGRLKVMADVWDKYNKKA
jgi:hypothetical protein